ncbi:VPLPA-CTERM sorting domain-containing protein [uncultured Roseobacter sp.]|uniref:VPLPA-CTERM sorting domain-containing protein n=1 Tax=uncultured Roseobacter sp. TaxID=114847 RepID=UPI00260B3713|nr:VPLPA-CTERM sorting domain-containing protein [uncultured Roseobacter sp.]
MNKLSILTCAFALTATTGFAATVDFEDEAPLSSDPLSVGTMFSNGIIDFSSTENMQLVVVGEPTSGFVPDDMPVGGDFGEIFLTGDFDGDTNMNLTFGAHTLDFISFDIADIDGDEPGQDFGGVGVDPTDNDEVFTFEFLLDGILQGSVVVDASDVDGDGEIATISYAGLFDEVSIVGTTNGHTRNIGWGIDNINTNQVPVPAAGLLLLAGIGGLGALRRRKKAA